MGCKIEIYNSNGNWKAKRCQQFTTVTIGNDGIAGNDGKNILFN